MFTRAAFPFSLFFCLLVCLSSMNAQAEMAVHQLGYLPAAPNFLVARTVEDHPPVDTIFDRVLRLSLIHYIDPLIPGPHFSYEHAINKNAAMRYQLGIPMNYNYRFQIGLEKLTGVRLRAGHRKYKPDHRNNPMRKFFREIAIDYLYLDARASENFRLGRLSSFNQELSYRMKKQSFGLAYILGITSYLEKKKRWQVDLGFGLGFRLQHDMYEKLADGLRYAPKQDSTLLFLYDINFWDYLPERSGWRIRLSRPIVFSLGHAF